MTIQFLLVSEKVMHGNTQRNKNADSEVSTTLTKYENISSHEILYSMCDSAVDYRASNIFL